MHVRRDHLGQLVLLVVAGGVVVGDAAVHADGQRLGDEPPGGVVGYLGALAGRVRLGVRAGGQRLAVHRVVAVAGDRAVASVLLPEVGVLHRGGIAVRVVAGAGPDQLAAVQRGGLGLALPAGPVEAAMVGAGAGAP